MQISTPSENGAQPAATPAGEFIDLPLNRIIVGEPIRSTFRYGGKYGDTSRSAANVQY